MKKTYICPALYVVRIESEGLMAASPDQLHDEIGEPQLVKSHDNNDESWNIFD